MNPVFQREMRAQSRGPKPWRLRMFVAGAAILGLATLGLKAPAMFVGSGKEAVFVMNFGAMALLGIVSPMLTHDLLSRERREGTLGLLCSTPLTSREMVVGKVTAACTQAPGASASGRPTEIPNRPDVGLLSAASKDALKSALAVTLAAMPVFYFVQRHGGKRRPYTPLNRYGSATLGLTGGWGSTFWSS
jgi:hypothetical protein